MAVYDLRGTHGSGKSTVLQNFAALGCARTLYQPCELGCFKCPKDLSKHAYGLLVMVPGVNGAVLCPGGHRGTLDAVRTQGEAIARVQRAIADGRHVLIEGFMHSPGLEPYASLARNSTVPWRFGFLDTPAEVCQERVLHRRRVRGNTEDLLPRTVKNIVGRHSAVEKVIPKFREAELDVQILPHQEPPAKLARRIAAFFQAHDV